MDIRLTLLARQDLEDLRRFTIDTWGQEQWRRYFAGIVLAFERVARDGRCGRPRSNLRYGMLGLDPAGIAGIEAPITLSRPRSRCPSCGHAIAWHENIPLVSYLRLAGKCSACKTRIALRYPIVELTTALLFAAIAWRFGAQPAVLLWCVG